MTAPAGWQQLPGGYTPNPAQQGQPQQQQGQPQGQPQQVQQQVAQAPQWSPPGQVGAPFEGTPPYYPPAPQQPMQQFTRPQPVVQPGQPMTVPQMQQQFQPQSTDMNARLTGPGVPPEIQGRTLGEAIAIYNGMRNVVLQTVPGPQQPAQPMQAPPAASPVAGQPQPAQTGWDWRNPEAGIARVMDERIQQTIMPALQPLLQQNSFQAVQAARNAAAAEIGPVFAHLEPMILQRLQGANPQTLQNPQMWRTAAESVIGNLSLAHARTQGQPQQPLTGQPMMQSQQVGQPTPNLNGFFTEQPTVGGAPGGGNQLTAQQQWAAQAMGMDPATYSSWSSGGIRR